MACKWLGQFSLPYASWLACPDHPRQRNTEKHARAAARKHLKESTPVHHLVKAVRVKGGSMYKLDGHTRTFLWETGGLDKPDMLQVNLLECDTLEEFLDAYYMEDAAAAAKTNSDTMLGVANAMGLHLTSGPLKDGNYKTALCMAIGCSTVDLDHAGLADALKDWEPELRMFDSLNFAANTINGGVKAAILLTLRRYGGVRKHGYCIQDFWLGVRNKQGHRDGKEMDGVQAAYEILLQTRAKGAKANWQAWTEIVGQLLTCAKAYMEGRSLQYVKAYKDKDDFRKRIPGWNSWVV